jgi:hypothetical protein
MVFPPPQLILALASITRDLGTSPFPDELVSLLQALRCKQYKSHPPLLEVGPSLA